MITQTAESQTSISPAEALQALKDGNKRFVERNMQQRDLLKQVELTSTGQYPFATVLHCIDSRVSAELIFDQGIGDLFSIRIAGNFVNEDILGSMEFATKLAGTKVILVLGHTHCGAVKGACDHVEMGNLTAALSKIKPVVQAVESDFEEKGSGNPALVQRVAEENVRRAIGEVKNNSDIIATLVENGDLLLVGGMYDIGSGEVTVLP